MGLLDGMIGLALVEPELERGPLCRCILWPATPALCRPEARGMSRADALPLLGGWDCWPALAS
jgi:hypothetical protein